MDPKGRKLINAMSLKGWNHVVQSGEGAGIGAGVWLQLYKIARGTELAIISNNKILKNSQVIWYTREISELGW